MADLRIASDAYVWSLEMHLTRAWPVANLLTEQYSAGVKGDVGATRNWSQIYCAIRALIPSNLYGLIMCMEEEAFKV